MYGVTVQKMPQNRITKDPVLRARLTDELNERLEAFLAKNGMPRAEFARRLIGWFLDHCELIQSKILRTLDGGDDPAFMKFLLEQLDERDKEP